MSFLIPSGYIFAIVAAIQLLYPTVSNRFQVRNISPEFGLKIAISRSSPPLAALSDSQVVFRDENPEFIQLAPVRQNVRILPGIRITRREAPIDARFEKSKVAETVSETIIIQQNVSQNFEKAKVSVSQPMTTHEYSTPNTLTDHPIEKVFNKSTERSTKPEEGTKTATYTEATYEISGKVETTLPIPQGGRIVVQRMVNGRPAESVIPSSDDHQFKIKTRIPTGFLTAVMKSADDDVIARGELSLDKIKKTGSRISDLKIVLTSRTASGAEGRVSSASGGNHTESPVNEVSVTSGSPFQASTDTTGAFTLSNLMKDSSVVLRGGKKGFANSIMLANSSHFTPMTMYSNKMVEGLIAIVGKSYDFDIKEATKYGIAWGRVSVSGVPLASAEVESNDSQAIGPIYFNDFHLPDENLKATSSNGMFVFLRMNRGAALIKAKHPTMKLSTRIVPIEENHVSHVDIETYQKEQAKILTFDAFNKTPLSTTVQFSGGQRSVKTDSNGALSATYIKNSDPLMLEVDSEADYLPSRFHSGRSEKVVGIPLVSHQWLNSLRLNQAPGNGLIIGFVDGARYDVFMDIKNHPHQEIYYFNLSGELVPVPVAGGGFVVANVPSGFQTVSIVPEGGGSIYQQAVKVDPEIVAVLAKKF